MPWRLAGTAQNNIKHISGNLDTTDFSLAIHQGVKSLTPWILIRFSQPSATTCRHYSTTSTTRRSDASSVARIVSEHGPLPQTAPAGVGGARRRREDRASSYRAAAAAQSAASSSSSGDNGTMARWRPRCLESASAITTRCCQHPPRRTPPTGSFWPRPASAS